MKKRKLRGFVLPTTYLLITITIFVGVFFMSKSLKNEGDYDYTTNITEENIKPVMEEKENASANTVIVAPVDVENVKINSYFYSKEDTEERQQQSLIFYENTYLPNTGLLYAKEESFEVKSAYNGKVSAIEKDEIMGTYVVVEHNSNLKTYYYGLSDIEVSVGDEITTNTVLGISANNAILNNTTSCLFEVYYKGELINPEKLINANIADFE